MAAARLWIGAGAALLLAMAAAGAGPSAVLPEIAAALSGNQPQKAGELASAALAQQGLSDAERARLLLDRGLAHEQQGAHAEALPDLTQALALHALPAADRATALFARGMAQDALGRLADALGDYDAALKLAPASAPALNNRANVLRRLGRLGAARRDYQASLAAGDTQPEYPYYGLGQIAEAEGDKEAARGFYARAVAANPGYRLAAERLEALGKPGEARPEPAVPPDAVPRRDRLAALTRPQTAQEAVQGAAQQVAQVRPRKARVALRPSIDGAATQRHAGPGLAQLGSWRQQAEASQAWERAVKRAGGELDGLTPNIVPVDLPGRGRYYRLRVGADDGAAKLCAALAAKGMDCLPVRD